MRKTRRFIHFLLILLFISTCYEASGSQEVLAMGRQDGARLACKGGIPLLLYEAPILPEHWRTSLGTLGSTGARHSQRGMFAYAAVLLVCI